MTSAAVASVTNTMSFERVPTWTRNQETHSADFTLRALRLASPRTTGTPGVQAVRIAASSRFDPVRDICFSMTAADGKCAARKAQSAASRSCASPCSGLRPLSLTPSVYKTSSVAAGKLTTCRIGTSSAVIPSGKSACGNSKNRAPNGPATRGGGCPAFAKTRVRRRVSSNATIAVAFSSASYWRKNSLTTVRICTGFSPNHTASRVAWRKAIITAAFSGP